jgi:hypothetical protein
MAAPSEEKLICDKFNLEALTVNQVKSFKALADGKDVFIETKTGSGIFAYISSSSSVCRVYSSLSVILQRDSQDKSPAGQYLQLKTGGNLIYTVRN